MSRFRKILLGALLSIGLVGTAFAANVPLLSGPWDPGNALGSLNAMVQSINSAVSGLQGSTVAAATTVDTSADTLATYTLPGNTLTSAGQLVRIRAFGTNSADANVKTFTLAFGASTLTQVVTGSGNNWQVECTVMLTASKAETAECHGTTGTTAIASNQATNWTVDNTAAVTVALKGTAATSGTMTLNAAYIEQVK